MAIKSNKWDIIKFKTFCKAKETKKRTKIQLLDYETIYANDATYKGFISKIYKQFIQLNIKTNKQTTQTKTGQKIKTDTSPQQTKRWPIVTWKDVWCLYLGEKCKLKPQKCINSHWSEWPPSKSLQTINAWEGVEKREPSYTVGRNINWYCHFGE